MTNPLPPSVPHRRRGFSLIEVLAAMTVLAIMVLLISKIFTDSTRAYAVGVNRTENNAVGRAILELMTREISCALSDDVVTLKVDTGADPALVGSSDRLNIATLSHKAEYRGGNRYRDAAQVQYAVMVNTNRASLLRRVTEDESGSYFSCYSNRLWHTTMTGAWSNNLTDSLVRFNVWAYDTNETYWANYDSQVRGPPLYIDICVQLMGEEDAMKAALMGGAGATYAQQAAHSYLTRVYLHNRLGFNQP